MFERTDEVILVGSRCCRRREAPSEPAVRLQRRVACDPHIPVRVGIRIVVSWLERSWKKPQRLLLRSSQPQRAAEWTRRRQCVGAGRAHVDKRLPNGAVTESIQIPVAFTE